MKGLTRVLPIDGGEWTRRLSEAGGPTHDDQSITWDGRRLDSKEKVLEFVDELELARREGRDLGPA